MTGKLPIGIQGFEKLRSEGFLYVDKTEYIYRLVHNNIPYFLSRPRRFGKSLLLSTLKAYFDGRKDLFKGLAIERLEQENTGAWQTYPVFYFDFNGVNYQDYNALEATLDSHLRNWESLYHPGKTDFRGQALGERFENILKLASSQTGLRCVILVDEYDKPLLETVASQKLHEHNKAVFKGFFSCLKKTDEYIQFTFITGVTKFHKVSIFSDLNQLKDISLSKDYSALCGITEKEMLSRFTKEIKALAKNQELSEEMTLAQLRKTYDGYLFHPQGIKVYNPFSLLNAFADGEFGSYWFETGTPAFLIQRLKAINFDVRKFTDRTLYAGESVLKDYSDDNPDPVPLLYQTGYLTIADYDKRKQRYTLCFPNDEVRYGFLESLMPVYVPAASGGSGTDIFTLDNYVESGNLEGMRKVFTALFSSIPYTRADDPFENYFQAVVYLVFTLLGKYSRCEMHTFSGRVDCILETENYIYIFEFKRDDTAENALRQIEDKGYILPYAADPRTIYEIGVTFDSEKRMLTDWNAVSVCC
ncbi:MAG: ATP-binding protein [Eubacterium sp.]|nr:ATP-binding protein [Eubacterium sp.]